MPFPQEVSVLSSCICGEAQTDHPTKNCTAFIDRFSYIGLMRKKAIELLQAHADGGEAALLREIGMMAAGNMPELK